MAPLVFLQDETCSQYLKTAQHYREAFYYQKIVLTVQLVLFTSNVYSYHDLNCGCNSCIHDTYDNFGFFTRADILYWTVCQGDLGYAVDQENNQISGEIHSVDYDWDLGFRILGGYRGGCNGWDTTFVFTTYSNSGNDSAESNNFLFGSLVHLDTGNNGNLFRSAIANIDLCYHTIDLLFGRTLCFRNDTVNVHPFFGGRVLRIEQSLKAKYQDPIVSISPKDLSSDSVIDVEYDSKYNGIGLHCGIDYSQKLYCGFDLYTNVSGSLVAGEAEGCNDQINTFSDGTEIITEQDVDVKARQKLVVPVIHLEGGLQYDTCVCK